MSPSLVPPRPPKQNKLSNLSAEALAQADHLNPHMRTVNSEILNLDLHSLSPRPRVGMTLILYPIPHKGQIDGKPLFIQVPANDSFRAADHTPGTAWRHIIV
jgi:hypothetical protein